MEGGSGNGGGGNNNNNTGGSNASSGPAVPFERAQRERLGAARGAAQPAQPAQPAPVNVMERTFQAPPLRQDLIEKAVGFLAHPKVQDTSLARKRDFLKEKKGMTEAEIDEAVRLAGVSDVAPTTIPHQQQLALGRPAAPQQPPPASEGYFSVATVFAGVVALASMGVAAYYAYSNYKGPASEKKGKKGKKGTSTPASAAKESAKKKPVAALPPKDKEESGGDDTKAKLGAAIANGLSDEGSAKLTAELERMMGLIEENNRQKFELLRSGSAAADETLRNDVQTIKQLLLTRQQIAVPPVVGAPATTSIVPFTQAADAKPATPASTPATGIAGPIAAKDDLSPDQPKAAATPAAAPVPEARASSGDSPAPASKPWEVRRRNRIESSTASAAMTPVGLGEPTSTSPPPPSGAEVPPRADDPN